jgi:hypothetical protein
LATPTAAPAALGSSSSGKPASRAAAKTASCHAPELVRRRAPIVCSARRRCGSSVAADQPSPHSSMSASAPQVMTQALCAEQPPMTHADQLISSS